MPDIEYPVTGVSQRTGETLSVCENQRQLRSSMSVDQGEGVGPVRYTDALGRQIEVERLFRVRSGSISYPVQATSRHGEDLGQCANEKDLRSFMSVDEGDGLVTHYRDATGQDVYVERTFKVAVRERKAPRP